MTSEAKIEVTVTLVHPNGTREELDGVRQWEMLGQAVAAIIAAEPARRGELRLVVNDKEAK